jgi:hypothetical protein
MPFDELVNKAIKEAVDAAVFVNLVGELGPLIKEAAACAQMLVNEAINEAAASVQMLDNKATDVAVNAAALVKLGEELGGTLTVRAPKSWSTRQMATLRMQLCSSSLGGSWGGTLTKGG